MSLPVALVSWNSSESSWVVSKRGAAEQSMIIRGLRGVGETVLLNAFEGLPPARARGSSSF